MSAKVKARKISRRNLLWRKARKANHGRNRWAIAGTHEEAEEDSTKGWRRKQEAKKKRIWRESLAKRRQPTAFFSYVLQQCRLPLFLFLFWLFSVPFFSLDHVRLLRSVFSVAFCALSLVYRVLSFDVSTNLRNLFTQIMKYPRNAEDYFAEKGETFAQKNICISFIT